jgi:hypothetical protein
LHKLLFDALVMLGRAAVDCSHPLLVNRGHVGPVFDEVFRHTDELGQLQMTSRSPATAAQK